MKMRRLKLGPMDNLSYLLWAGGKCAVIDPAWQPQKLADAAAEEKLEIACVLLTHAHPDHVNGVSFFSKNYPSVPVYLHEADNFMLETRPPSLRALKPGEPVAELPEVSAIHTPGHTPGSVCYQAGGYLFTGDTLFVGECGRVDLPGSSPEALYDSFARLAWLGDDLTVCPGHSYNGESSTLRVQKEYNLYLKLALQGRRDDFLKAVT